MWQAGNFPGLLIFYLGSVAVWSVRLDGAVFAKIRNFIEQSAESGTGLILEFPVGREKGQAIFEDRAPVRRFRHGLAQPLQRVTANSLCGGGSEIIDWRREIFSSQQGIHSSEEGMPLLRWFRRIDLLVNEFRQLCLGALMR
jgi:hypothetical protein